MQTTYAPDTTPASRAPSLDHDTLLNVAEAMLTRAGRFIVQGEPLAFRRQYRPFLNRIRWARRIVRAARKGGASWLDVEDALKAGCRPPANNDCEFGWAAFHACMGARTVLGLTGYVD
jgi:hypothetical protein